MAENIPNFAEARRGGYDKAQVTAYVGGLIREMEAAHSKVGELTRAVEKLHAENNKMCIRDSVRAALEQLRPDQLVLASMVCV